MPVFEHKNAKIMANDMAAAVSVAVLIKKSCKHPAVPDFCRNKSCLTIENHEKHRAVPDFC